MKIALTTIGSRGDIQPYIALGISIPLLDAGRQMICVDTQKGC